jgi:lipopolysaccharide/colanic/teichoic acid biosynthesis glycosyltransferase
MRRQAPFGQCTHAKQPSCSSPGTRAADPQGVLMSQEALVASAMQAMPAEPLRTAPRAALPAARSTPRLHAVEAPGSDATLPRDLFLHDLKREIRRADRTQAPLSMVMFQISDRFWQQSPHADELLDVLHSQTRETDALGHVGDQLMAVLCPDTDAAGAQHLIQKINAQATHVRYTAQASTYPDDVFRQWATGLPERADHGSLLRADVQQDDPQGSYALKRPLDVLGALLALLLFAPLMIVVALAIAWTSRGPIIFKQQRVGYGGRPFTFYKFRSMAVNNDDSAHRAFAAQHILSQNPVTASDGTRNMGAPTQARVYKIKADARVTRVGRFIRKTSIDELPQLFNVLKGEMSLVGPRPPLPYETAVYKSWHLRRLMTVKPGMTGVWQVEGRSSVTFNEMVRMDLRYIRECTLRHDLTLLLKTVAVVVLCKGAD